MRVILHEILWIDVNLLEKSHNMILSIFKSGDTSELNCLNGPNGCAWGKSEVFLSIFDRFKILSKVKIWWI